MVVVLQSTCFGIKETSPRDIYHTHKRETGCSANIHCDDSLTKVRGNKSQNSIDVLLIDRETVTCAEGNKRGAIKNKVPHQNSPLGYAAKRRRFETKLDYQDRREVGGEGGLVLKQVAVSVQCCTAFKHHSVQSGTD